MLWFKQNKNINGVESHMYETANRVICVLFNCHGLPNKYCTVKLDSANAGTQR